MYLKLFLTMILLLVTSNFQELPAYADPVVSHKQPFVMQKNPEGIFKVNLGKLFVITGSKEACQGDNDFLIAALKSQNVHLNKLGYKVIVNKINTSIVQKNNKNPLIVYRYEIDTVTGDKSYNHLICKLKSKSSITGQVSTFKAPVTCHYLVVRDKLVLLSYYGFPSYYRDFQPEKLILTFSQKCGEV
ncbi:MAG TPA: hypothetical protein VEC37_03220 [Bacillota bacterium]|nr:hypothetical protein [Bacillota bacterium]